HSIVVAECPDLVDDEVLAIVVEVAAQEDTIDAGRCGEEIDVRLAAPVPSARVGDRDTGRICLRDEPLRKPAAVQLTVVEDETMVDIRRLRGEARGGRALLIVGWYHTCETAYPGRGVDLRLARTPRRGKPRVGDHG